MERMSRIAEKVIATDISAMVLKRAAKRFPSVRFFNADVGTLSSEFFSHFDLIVWLDAVYWLSYKESCDVLRRISEGIRGRSVHFMVSARIVFPEGTDMDCWQGHDFNNSEQFIKHIRQIFPSARSVPVQLNLNVRSVQTLSVPQRLFRYFWKGLNHLGGYRMGLRYAQLTVRWRILYHLIEPFVIHLAMAAK